MIKVVEIKTTGVISDSINEFILDNPSIKIMDIKYSVSSFQSVGRVGCYSGVLIVYEEGD